MRRFDYFRKHLPTGEVTKGTMDARDFEQLCYWLNDYNRSSQMVGGGDWVYWAIQE